MKNKLDLKISIKSVLRFTLPSVLMMVVMSFYTIVDGTFVSRLIGTDAFSAVNIIYPLSSLIIGIGTMFGTGSTAIISLMLGKKQQKEAKETLSFIIAFTILLGLALSGLSLLFLDQIIYALGSNAQIFQYCKEYALPIIFFFPASMLQLQFQTLYVAAGKPSLGLITTIAGGLANVALDYIFIAKFNMGISGAAIATGIGYSIPALFGLLYFSLGRKGSLHFVKPKLNWKVLFQAATNGSSEMVSFLSGSITTLLFNVIMMKMNGQNGVAAISILLYLDFILIAISLGYSMGISPVISYNYGAGNTEKLKRLFKISRNLCCIVGLTMTAATFLFADGLASIFTPKESPVYLLAVSGLKIYAFSYLFKGYNIFSSALFTAFGNGKISAIISFLRTLVFLVLSLLTLSTLFGVTGVWYATPLSELLAFGVAVFMTVRYRKKYHYI